ncbi:MAG TPA: DUF559 domain-containing protein [Hyphomicrobium sp.]|nr:DUF559 domain-containing protein [Hyphomicrobium sp.]
MRRAQPWLTNRSRVLRASDIPAEQKLWSKLRNRQLGGFKFVRQEPIGGFFADFVCRERKLVIEVDGATHGEQSEIDRDRERDIYLSSLGYQVMRITNADVEANLGGVLDTIIAKLENAVTVRRDVAPHPGPLPARGERE